MSPWTTTVPVMIGALHMIKKGTNKHINQIPGSPSLYEIKKLLFTEHLILLRKYNQCDWKNNT